VYTVTTLAGGSANGNTYGKVDGTGSSALFRFPAGVVVGSSGSLFVADSFNHKIRVVDTVSGVVTTLVGGGSTGNTYGSVDGVGTSALLDYPTGLANLDIVSGFASDTLVCSDQANNKVRRSTGIRSKRRAVLMALVSSPPHPSRTDPPHYIRRAHVDNYWRGHLGPRVWF